MFLRSIAKYASSSSRNGLSKQVTLSTQCRRTFATSKEENIRGDPHGETFSMTKVVGTIGPVSENLETLQTLIHEGLRIMRINFSHATYDEANLRISNLRQSRGVHSAHGHHFNLRSILLDTCGPEIRCGSNNDNLKIELRQGAKIILTTLKEFEHLGSSERIYVNHAALPTTVQANDTILLDDGLIQLTVLKTDVHEIECEIQNTDFLGSKKGVNLPGLEVNLPILTTKDRQDIEYGIKNDVDFVAASFVRTGEDVTIIRDFITEVSSKYWPSDHPQPQIISKIENMQGIDNFEEILSLSDGIMVARGDLGVEVPLQKVLTYQKYMVDRCNAVGKPVIVATQMLDSMIRNPRPTRAEVCDVGNAVLDGADCVMLSGETAQGTYPLASVQTMMRVIKEADSLVALQGLNSQSLDTTSSAAVSLAQAAQADLMIVLTGAGQLAQAIAQCRPVMPVMCYVASQKVGRQLQIYRSLYPVIHDTSAQPSVKEALENAQAIGWTKVGDTVVVITDQDSEHVGTNMTVRLIEVQ